MSQPRFTLYSSEGCHLCVVAEQLLGSLPQFVAQGCDIVEISFDDALVHQFGSRIPVLFDGLHQIYYDWPFEQSDILDLLN